MTWAAHPLNFPKEERYDEWWGGENKVGGGCLHSS